MGCRAALRVRYSHWEYKDSLGKSGPGQSLTQVKFIKRWEGLAESGSRATGTALSHCRNLGRDSMLPPLGLASGTAAGVTVAHSACRVGRTGADVGGAAESETATAGEGAHGSVQRVRHGRSVVAPSNPGAMPIMVAMVTTRGTDSRKSS